MMGSINDKHGDGSQDDQASAPPAYSGAKAGTAGYDFTNATAGGLVGSFADAAAMSMALASSVSRQRDAYGKPRHDGERKLVGRKS